MVRWSDGLYGGLLAGTVVVGFYWLVDMLLLKDSTLPGFFAEIASGFLKGGATPENLWVVLFGLCLHYVLSAAFGIVYAVIARYVRAMWHAPTSVIFGLTYGLIVWFVLNDFFVPVFGVASTQPLWVGLVANTIFYGFVISEFITVAQRAKEPEPA
jgi:uncharacterized membrane protein YagU involved in acid resistance